MTAESAAMFSWWGGGSCGPGLLAAALRLHFGEVGSKLSSTSGPGGDGVGAPTRAPGQPRAGDGDFGGCGVRKPSVTSASPEL